MSNPQPNGGGGGASLGFSIKGKARAKVAVNVAEARDERQLITEVAADGTIKTAAGGGDGSGGRRQYVVPALQNTYKTGVGKFVPSFVPESSAAAVTGTAEDRYERAVDVGQAPQLSSFGLEVRGPKAGGGSAGGDADAPAANGSASGAAVAGLVAAKQQQHTRADDAAQLKADLEALPEVASVEDYESLPVEEFGKALLRGLGWSDGQGVGRKRQLVEPKQMLRRPERLGLGANPAAPPPDKRPRKMGDKPRETDLVAAPTADGRVRHRVGLDEALVPRSSLAPGPQRGKVMAVVRGRHAGLVCAVREVHLAEGEASGPATRVLVELRPSGEVVELAAEELDERDAAARAKPPAAAAAAAAGGSSGDSGSRARQREHNGERGGTASSDRDPERDRDRERDRERGGRSGGDGSGGSQRERSSGSRQQQRLPPRPVKLWVAALIRVRIVDKHIKGGRLYLKKGTVLDVSPDGSCDVRLEEEGRSMVTVHQDQLETVVPKDAGAAVMVLAGEHKGRKGRLLQASISGGAAALQLLGDMQLVRCSLDDCAEFMGHLDEEDY